MVDNGHVLYGVLPVVVQCRHADVDAMFVGLHHIYHIRVRQCQRVARL